MSMVWNVDAGKQLFMQGLIVRMWNSSLLTTLDCCQVIPRIQALAAMLEMFRDLQSLFNFSTLMNLLCPWQRMCHGLDSQHKATSWTSWPVKRIRHPETVITSLQRLASLHFKSQSSEKAHQKLSRRREMLSLSDQAERTARLAVMHPCNPGRA